MNLTPRLLVPMNVEALIIGATAQDTQWVNLKPDFRGVYFNQFLGQQLETEPCSATDPDLYDEPGVHLHWALPDGLTHGVADSGGPEFPLIPNRWLVLRLWYRDVSKPQLEFKGWIVESDTIRDDENGTVWPLLRSENPDPAKNRDYYAFVGKQFEMSHWPGEVSAPGVDITAVGYGTHSFAAYYPACRGILGFQDNNLDDLQDVTLTYFVAGWYSDPSKDPLRQALTEKTVERLEEFLGERKWTYPGFGEALDKVKKARQLEVDLKEAQEMAVRLKASRPDSETEQAVLQKQIAELETERQTLGSNVEAFKENLPDQILCHGIISGIQWQKKDTRYDTGVPRGKPFSVAVGDTAVDALTALFKKQLDAGLVELLEAFQYDLLTDLEKPGGQDKVEHKLHERTFRPLGRGTRWDLIQESAPPAGASTEENSSVIPGDIRLLLENVNARQRLINRLKRQRESRKSELYAAWYKSVLNIGASRVIGETLNRQLAVLQQGIADLSTQIAALEDEKEGRPKGDEWDQIQKSLDTFLPGYKLLQLDEPLFWRPNDPVVLLAGEPFQRSSRYGEDGRYRSDGQLLCRLSGQEITRLKITIPHAKKVDVEFGPEDLDRWRAPFAPRGKPVLPPEIVNLFRESLFLTLDSTRAGDIAVTAYERNEAGLAKGHPDEVKELSRDLVDRYLTKVWADAADPNLENPALRYEEQDQDGQSAWEFAGRFPSPVVMNRWQKNPWLPMFLQWQVSWVAAYSDTTQALQSWNLNGQGTAFDWNKDKDAGGQRPARYSGTTLLSPSATLQFSDRLRQYNLTHDNAKLRAFQTAVSFMNLLCQSLGGFTENLLMRKARLELKPLDPRSAGGPRLSPIFDQVEDIDWLSPLIDSSLFPIRAGHLKLEKLWIIDAFGQLLQLENEDQNKLAQPFLPERVAGSDGYFPLEPRLSQPARLTIQWLPANRYTPDEIDEQLQNDEEFNPVCGWILPNFLDSGLMIYDDRGYALGVLQAVQRKSWAQGAGASREEIESFHWVDIPGSEAFFFGRPPAQLQDPLGEKANPHLRAFVKGLLSLTEESGPAFGELLKKMNEALSATSGSSTNPNLALLIGKPLALVRASIRLELDGDAACAQGWDDLQKAQSGGIENVNVPLRLGDRRKWNNGWLGDDGLVGFFLDRDYRQFYPAFGLEGRSDDCYSKYGKLPEVSVGKPLDLTLLMDPSQGLCATAGILPRTIFNLPYGDITETLENKQVIFFTGPLLSTETEIRMPQPSDVYGQWSWTHHPEVKVWSEEPIIDSQKEQGRFFDESLQISEGWLKLITAPLTIRVFKVKGREPVKDAQFEAIPGERIILSWVATGAEEIELKEGATSLFKSNRHPLPTQYQIQVDQNTSLTLIATGRAAASTKEKTIDIRVVTKSS